MGFANFRPPLCLFDLPTAVRFCSRKTIVGTDKGQRQVTAEGRQDSAHNEDRFSQVVLSLLCPRALRRWNYGSERGETKPIKRSCRRIGPTWRCANKHSMW
ncbi:hypothetical protein L596_028280 [Steinernema carpocapsae]|uniref:Uncharacterized protein n=1 Tax=Steinernema carpocapsae TaxID=34508 RepID=A0A4U5LY15_STECR|nr:hypothetical protein L596_028280 [Steinernema carpocapsae]